jgi:hypothetical protein
LATSEAMQGPLDTANWKAGPLTASATLSSSTKFCRLVPILYMVLGAFGLPRWLILLVTRAVWAFHHGACLMTSLFLACIADWPWEALLHTTLTITMALKE